ncbi:hypothetical protein ACLB2K_021998 [Fragaria x ananassa]
MVFGDVHQNVNKAREALSAIQQDIDIHGMIDQKFEDEVDAKFRVLNAVKMQESYWKDRARVKWLTDRDRSTSFFHAYAKVRSTSAQMSSIHDGERILFEPSDIAAHVVGFYQNLYSSSTTPRNLDEVCSVIHSLVTNAENDWLTVIPSTEEIKNAVFAMDPSSAPGLDRFPGCFYQSCWDIVGWNVVACVRQFFLQNWLLPNINCNFLVPLPKVQDAHEITQFRPIALANFLFKIIPKILASRLGPIAARIISPKLSPSGPKPFRFQSMWLNHPIFRDTVATCWSSSKFWGCPIYVTVQKLKVLKSCLRNWNKMVFGDVHQNVNKAREALSAIQQDIAIHGMIDQKFEDEVDAKFRVLNAVKMQESYWKDRARVKWLTDRDRSTSFFHAYAKVRSTSAQMSSIHDGERILFEPSDIAAHVVGFYQNLYSSSTTPRNLDEVCSVIHSLVTNAENDWLTVIPSTEEIKNAVFAMDPSSAPGLDRFPGCFYQSCWDIVGWNVVACVRQFFLQNWLLPNINCNFLVPLPKVQDAHEITQFRPIALANFLFKIIPKILASRLGPIAARIISPKLSPSGPKPFRFQSMWLNHPIFRDTVATCWSSSKFWGCPIYVTVQKLKVLKSCLRNWNKMVFGDVHQNVNKAREALSAIQQDIAIHGMIDQKFEDEVDAKFRVLNAVKMQESYWKDRARVKWLTDRDRSTSFFHAYAKVRSTSAQMSSIHDGERILFEPSDIAAHVVGFYQNLYSSSTTPRNLDEVCSVIHSLVTNAENDWLTVIPSTEEIKNAVFAMDPSSAPGLDRFPGCFYQSCWDIVGWNVVACVRQFFLQNWLLPNINCNFLVPLPKVQDAHEITQFRPIALANFLFKIIPKILASRLGPIAARIISPKLSPSGPKPFRFQSMWLNHPIFRDTVATCWSSSKFWGCPIYVTVQKLKVLKSCLRNWNKMVFGDVHQNVNKAREALSAIQQDIAIHGMIDQKFEDEVDAKFRVLNAVKMQESYWKDRARVKWLTDRDRSTSFFHAYAKVRSTSAQMSSIHDGERILFEPSDIAAHVVGFYQNLYSSSTTPRNLDEVCSVIHSLVTNAENDWLTVIPSTEEIKNAVFAMDPSSAPGLDRFPGCFYQSCWDIVGWNVVACVRQFFLQNWLLPNINCNFLVPLPKVQDAHEITQFRPIALANFLFKIIPKILASRLGPIAARIISPKLSPSGPKPFRFQSMWLNHPIFRDTVATCWSSSKFWGCPIYVTVQKLKVLKSCLRNWNKMVFGDVHQNVNKAREALSAIQQDIPIHGMIDQKFEDEVDAKFRVLNAVKIQESYWKDRARVKWLTDRDRSTSFFHAYAKVRSTSAQMSSIHDGERILFEPSDIAAHVVGFYQNLYSSSTTPRNLDEVCSVIHSLVTNAENDWLTVIPSTEEIKNAVFAMDPSSAPGLDRFPGCFYQSCWDIVGWNVVACVRQFFLQNWLLPNINCNFLVPLPKVQDAHEITQFRPIALANFLFKIIPKILASRLGPIAARIISPKLSPSGPKPFRFQSMWLNHPIFRDTVATCWSSSKFWGCPIYVTVQKLKVLKSCLRNWNKMVFGDVHQNVNKAREALSAIQQDIAIHGMIDQKFEDEVDAKFRVLNAVKMQESYWKDRARVKWLTDRDRSTSFFHAYAKVRSTSAQMSSIHDGERILFEPSDIAAHVVGFYQNLYSSSTTPRNLDEVCSVIHSLVTNAENDWLTVIPSTEEIKNAVFAMDPSSAPGLDRFPANFLFKIIPKILASRLGPIAARIISPKQGAFIPARRITSCIGTVSECFNLLDHKAYSGNVGIKVNIAKAFNTLHWDFLHRVLKNFGFSNIFTNWIITILKSARLSILINGSPHGFFSCSRGVRQGDPLSPLLFCLAEEALSRDLSMLLSSGRLKPISFPRTCTPPSHVLYADDFIVFCHGDKLSLSHLRRFFDRYSAASGQYINAAKSTFYLGAKYHHRQATIQRILGFRAGRLPFIYLGVPIFCGKPRRCHLQVIADKAKSRLMGWQGRLLSMAGRTQLVQSVFQRTRKIVTIRWARVCAPKLEGGLGIRDLPSLNSAAILKFAWDSFSSHSQWGDYVRSSNLHLADFISHQSWQLPPFFCQAFPLLARQISDLALPLIDESDMLIWEPSTSGELTFAVGYEFLRHHNTVKDWACNVW